MTATCKRAIAPLLLLLLLAMPAAAEETKAQIKQNTEQLNIKRQELTELDDKIQKLKRQHATATSQAELASDQVARLNKQLQAAKLALEQTLLAVSSTKREIKQITVDLEQITGEIDKTREQLKQVLRALYQYEQISFIDIILSRETFGTVLSDQRTYRTLQQSALDLINELKEKQLRLTEHRAKLATQQDELSQLKMSQAYQQADISRQRQGQKEFLNLKQRQQASYQQRLTEAKQARDEIKQKIFTLKAADLEVSLTDAFSAARYASSLTGIRPALLLAILKVETNVGEQLGSGIFPEDMHPASRDAFLRLTAKLGRDPKNTPISRRPTSYQGWGGAIGPGQFMPQTWESLESRVAQLMSKETPDPFVLADALVATGIMMADRGAANPAKEAEAVARFLAGPNWIYYTWYSDRVLAVAKEYAAEGL